MQSKSSTGLFLGKQGHHLVEICICNLKTNYNISVTQTGALVTKRVQYIQSFQLKTTFMTTDLQEIKTYTKYI